MIHVYATADGRARCITFDDHERGPPLELLAAFEEEESRAGLGAAA